MPSSLAFMGLLTDAEQSAITAASLSSPPLMLWLLKMAAAQDVNPDDPRTGAGLASLVSAGLLSQSRSDAIIAAARAMAPTMSGGRIVGVVGAAVTTAVQLSDNLQIAPDRKSAFGWNALGSPVGYAAPDGGLLYQHDQAGVGWSFDSQAQTFTAPPDPVV